MTAVAESLVPFPPTAYAMRSQGMAGEGSWEAHLRAAQARAWFHGPLDAGEPQPAREVRIADTVGAEPWCAAVPPQIGVPVPTGHAQPTVTAGLHTADLQSRPLFALPASAGWPSASTPVPASRLPASNRSQGESILLAPPEPAPEPRLVEGTRGGESAGLPRVRQTRSPEMGEPSRAREQTRASVVRNEPGRLSVHVEQHTEGLHVWFGVPLGSEACLTQIAAGLNQHQRALGRPVAAVVCNGKPVHGCMTPRVRPQEEH
jgi:hypothetical protein